MAQWSPTTQGWPLPNTTLAVGTTYSPWMVSHFANSIQAAISCPAAGGGATNPTLIVTLETTEDPAALDTSHSVTQLNTAVITFSTIAATAVTGETKDATVYKATPDKLGAYTRVKAVVAADSGTPTYQPSVQITMRS